MANKSSTNFVAIPPGATIKEQLIDRNMSQKEFAVRMNLSEKHISKLINGEVQLTYETANKLEMVLGIPARFWNNLEAIYRENLIKVETEKEMEDDIEIAKHIPYSEMVHYGWIASANKAIEKVENLRKFFEVTSLSLLGNNQLTKIACRRLAVTEKSDLALMVFVQKAKIESRSLPTKHVNLTGLNKLIPELRSMTKLDPNIFCPLLQEKLADNGIALVFLPHLKGSYLHGATFAYGSKIVVGMTVRGKDADKFWFSLFHELAHIVLGHIDQEDGLNDKDEKDADQWAANTLIPDAIFESFKHTNDFSKNSVLRFAKEQNIDPGIVVGRLQTEHAIEFNKLNHLKTQYSLH